MGTLVFFDLETGGTKWWPHVLAGKLVPMNPIIQIGAIAVEEGTLQELEVFEQKLAFQTAHANPDALAMNSYDADLWSGEAVSSFAALLSFDKFLRRHASIKKMSRNQAPYRIAALAGHNAAAFDLPFLRAWYDQYGRFLPAAFQVLDTMILARIYAHATGHRFENYKLETICKAFGVAPGHHDALADIRATVQIAKIAMAGLKR